MLAFVREQVIGDAQQAVDGNFQAHLFEGLANCAGLEGFEELYLAADDAPTPRFRGKFSQRQQNPAAFVNEQDTGPYSWGGSWRLRKWLRRSSLSIRHPLGFRGKRGADQLGQ